MIGIVSIKATLGILLPVLAVFGVAIREILFTRFELGEAIVNGEAERRPTLGENIQNF